MVRRNITGFVRLQADKCAPTRHHENGAAPLYAADK